MSIRLTAFVLFFCVLGCVSYGQDGLGSTTMPNIGSPVPLPPNAAALGKFGDVPIGYYTGVPNISVPIYEIKTSSLDLPISIDYHAGGIKVEEIASWVGLGWSLNAGGVINRQLRGLADEADGGYLQSYSDINKYLNATMTDDELLTYLQNLSAGREDAQQDLFIFNFGGQSGKFIFDSTGAVLPIPDSRLLIQNGAFLGQSDAWKVTDLRGNQYFFANTESSLAQNVLNGSLQPSLVPTSISSWYLTKIINPQGTDSIVFTYELSVTKTNSSVAQTKYSNANAPDAICTTKPTDSRYTSTTTFGQQLTKISFANGIILFNASSQSRCDLPSNNSLSSIEVKSTDGSLDKLYTFNQHYQTSNALPCDTTQPENTRLFLDSIVITDVVGQDTGKYLFAYNSGILPSRLSYNQDHWGFFNGADNGSNLVPPYFVNVSAGTSIEISGADRDPDPASAQAGMLQSITYPTGGKTVFAFEGNTANNYVEFGSSIPPQSVGTENYIVGFSDFHGLLPKLDTTLVIPWSEYGAAIVTVSFNNGGGICDTEEEIGCPLASLSGPIGAGDPPPVSTGVISSAGTILLTPGTYNVHIDLTGVTDSNTIKSVLFTASWPIYDTLPAGQVNHNTVVGGLRIQSITDYDLNNQVTSSRSFSYLYPDSTAYSSGSLLNLPEYNGQMTIWQQGEVGLVEISEACMYQSYSSASNYPLVATQSSYVGYKYVTETIGQKGEYGKNIYQLNAPDQAFDITNKNFPYPPSTSRDYLRGQTTDVKNYRFNAVSGGYDLVQEKKTDYNFQVPNSFTGLAVGVNIFFGAGFLNGLGASLYTVAPFITEQGWLPPLDDTATLYDQNDAAKSIQTTNAYTYSNVHFQLTSATTTDSKGNTVTSHMSYPFDYTGLSGSDPFTRGVLALQNANIVTPVIEKYTQKTAPGGTLIGTVNATATEFNAANFEPDTIFSTELTQPTLSFSALSVSAGSLVKSSLYFPEVAFNRYDLLGNIIEQQKINDMKNAYIWDYNHAYPIAEVKNADSASIAYTSFEADGTGNWTISGGADSAGGITGNGSFALSGATISKSGLNSANTYVVSYWTTNSTSYSITGTISGYPIQGKTINGWTYFEHKVTAQSSVSISGSGKIDELRLYPSNAQMKTLTYSPLIGVTSDCDVDNKVDYYFYDGLGRLKYIKDQDGNIVKTFDYHYTHL